jgi:hypothetical protein
MNETNEPNNQAPEPSDFERLIIDAIKGEGMLLATKKYDEFTGNGLVESKKSVEAIASKYGVRPPEGYKSAGCFGVLAILLVALLLVYII